jgi:peptide/nickel transport system permease protein
MTSRVRPMLRFIVQRLLAMVLVIFLVSIAVFSLTLMIPGDPAITISGESATLAQIERTRERLGLDKPVLEQYWSWASGVIRGDLGTSLFSSLPVSTAIAQRFPATLSVAIGASVVMLIFSIPAGIISAVNVKRLPDTITTFFASVGVAMPSFWVGLLLILVFGVWFEVLPAVGYVGFTQSPTQWARHLVLPSIALSLVAASEMTRQLRGSLAEALSEDYVRMARSKGLPNRVVIGKHAMKNALLPVVTLFGMQIGFMLSGAVIVEQVFGIPGIGQLAIRSVLDRDIPMIQGVVLVSSVVVMTCNFVVDLLYGYLNPRLRVGVQ